MDNWIKKDLKYNWHPYTQMKDCQTLPPILIEKAKGLKLYDSKGNFYYDTISSWWCNVHGHNHPFMVKAIKDQLNKLDHVLFAGFTHKPAILLSEKLISISPPNLTKVFYSDNGSTAVEVALKMSFQYWKNKGIKDKNRFVSLDSAYHGDTIGSMSVSGISLFSEIFKPLYIQHYKVPTPYCYRCPVNKNQKDCRIECLKPLEILIRKNERRISAIIIEPLLLAASGMIIYPKEFLKKVDILVKKYNIHLILDEVATGFGRTGKMFACEYCDIKPDFLCLSKGITSGTLPLAATLTTEDIYQAFYDDYINKKTFYHGHTYTANPISCSAALASLEIFEKDDTLTKIQPLIKIFHQLMERFLDIQIIGDVRYIGLVGAIELVRNRNTKQRFDFKERIGFKIYKMGLKKRVILRPLGDIIYFYLPFCITKNEINYILSATYEIIRSLSKRYLT
ncbi:MAG: adenosylmethionine--8-amino-7-oxononanoate transaminase [Candidatus Hydrogenedentota bacterium]